MWLPATRCSQRLLTQSAVKLALPHEKSAFGLSTNPPTIEVFSNSATRTPLRSCSFAKPTEIGIVFSLRQIFHEATCGVAVVLAEQICVESFQRRQTCEKEWVFKADEHCSSSTPYSITRHHLPRNACSWMPLSKPLGKIAHMRSGSSTLQRSCNKQLGRMRQNSERDLVWMLLFVIFPAINQNISMRSETFPLWLLGHMFVNWLFWKL